MAQKANLTKKLIKKHPKSAKKEKPAKTKKASGRPGLWANIHAKRARIENGSREKMREPGSKGAPTDKAILKSQATSIK